jgi:hypothetical protein
MRRRRLLWTRVAAVACAEVVIEKPAVMEVAMVFILTLFFGTIGVIFMKLRYCVPTRDRQIIA